MKTLLLLLSLFLLAFAGAAFAQEAETSVEAVVEAETITAADLGVGDSGLLPTSPFYFFKEIGRGLQRAFTFNSVAKTELETLKIQADNAEMNADLGTVAEIRYGRIPTIQKIPPAVHKQEETETNHRKDF